VHVSSVEIEDVALAGLSNQPVSSFRILPVQNISKRCLVLWLIVAVSGLGRKQLGIRIRIVVIYC
jgi:hypothetical protein